MPERDEFGNETHPEHEVTTNPEPDQEQSEPKPKTPPILEFRGDLTTEEDPPTHLSQIEALIWEEHRLCAGRGGVVGKISFIKTLRKLTDLSLMEAKAITDFAEACLRNHSGKRSSPDPNSAEGHNSVYSRGYVEGRRVVEAELGRKVLNGEILTVRH